MRQQTHSLSKAVTGSLFDQIGFENFIDFRTFFPDFFNTQPFQGMGEFDPLGGFMNHKIGDPGSKVATGFIVGHGNPDIFRSRRVFREKTGIPVQQYR